MLTVTGNQSIELEMIQTLSWCAILYVWGHGSFKENTIFDGKILFWMVVAVRRNKTPSTPSLGCSKAGAELGNNEKR